MISAKLLLYGFFYVCFFFAFLFNGGKIGLQRQPIMAYQPEKVTAITFDKDIKPIMNTYCGGIFCHHGKPSAWTKYEFTKKAVDSGTFYDRVIEKRDMPKRKSLPEKEYETIKKWLENGAPKN